ncbi:mannose-6-phosphate isomerase [Cytophagales bacterium LB-30]|uniref:Mannose-6-phosphate isomerase n=1 Tax=Shiella aurantiaca TaxID=3058365 RepID=A0ABT8F6C0_9BACT|nr:type I phosphomannose isomerase catalytic subunit [Shiella aurantiaca]MDN4166017.1 mannose-6-phosphate isomerase [Shiella aurantiaca]
MAGYPLTFHTQFKDKIWGGQKIRTRLGKDFSPLPNCGETWEISAVVGNISVVKNGDLSGKPLDAVISENPEMWLGKSVIDRFGEEFPLLIKFIDAAEDLSVQVHPNDALAASRHQGRGKSEMWYILEADKGATLIDGFSRNLSREEYLKGLAEGRIMSLLNKVPAERGDVFYIPAGRVHTIGKGLLLAEIQQTSDITYRIYDFDRVDAQGNTRELHTELALDALDFSYVPDVKCAYDKSHVNEVLDLIHSPYFETNKLLYTRSLVRDLSAIDSFKVYICLEGTLEIRKGEFATSLAKGDCALVPASWKVYELRTEEGFELLETYIGE